MKYFRLTANSEGGSEMEVVDVAVSPVGFIPDQPALDLSEPKDSKSFTFIRTPSGWSGGWHPSPRRQYVIGISGELEFKTTDGKLCRVTPAVIVLLEDTSGKGHHTRVATGEDWWGVLIGLE